MPSARLRRNGGNHSLRKSTGQLPPYGHAIRPLAGSMHRHGPLYRPVLGVPDEGQGNDRASARWTVFFLVVTFASWLMGTLELVWYYERLHRYGQDRARDTVVMSVLAVLFSEAVYFVLGFAALCVAAFCLTVETCSGARGRERHTWGKYSKEV
ncbi:uncharacterized protein PpBr36_06445 [Pyricularia pennisetigena]|uniref:uncharacterized protein n=1 Tax=Pyricularia pennisetigena TaxID=1578925 RepID=UPI0011514B34|nr:uncharacterized protein PpBr36_06445 [Pyricularia pennisetigena]TLS23589.1 hypothetical protein PpBr36_06445 [Pyricularia pennisetigena]